MIESNDIYSKQLSSQMVLRFNFADMYILLTSRN